MTTRISEGGKVSANTNREFWINRPIILYRAGNVLSNPRAGGVALSESGSEQSCLLSNNSTAQVCLNAFHLRFTVDLTASKHLEVVFHLLIVGICVFIYLYISCKMSAGTCSCSHVQWLQQQVSVMRKEIKNLRYVSLA